MAIIRTSAILQGISGHVGSLNFLQPHQGNVVRQRRRLTKVRTSRQLANQAQYGAIRASWRSMPAGTREMWNYMASLHTWQDRLGVPRQPSGWQLFFKAQRLRLLVGLSINQYAGLLTTFAPSYQVTLTASVSTGTVLSFYPTPTPSTTYIVVQAARPVSNLNRRHYSNWRMIYGALLTTTTLNITSQFAQAFGQPGQGEYIAARAYFYLASRLPSPWNESHAPVTA